VAVDDTNVYWTVQSNLTNEAGAVLGSIVTCGLLGCGAVGTAAVTPLVPQPVDFVLDPFNAYWTTGYGQVQKCPLPTCDGGPVTIDDEGIMHANGVAVGVASLYWTLPTKGDVMTCAVSGCVPEVFASGLDSPSKVIVVGSNVYWSDNSAEAGAIMTCPTSGCPDGGPSPFVSGQPGAFAVAADGTNLYFTRLESNGSVLACPLSGCPKPTVLASGQNSAKVVVQDAVSVYWLTSNALMRVAKP